MSTINHRIQSLERAARFAEEQPPAVARKIITDADIVAAFRICTTDEELKSPAWHRQWCEFYQVPYVEAEWLSWVAIIESTPREQDDSGRHFGNDEPKDA